MRENLVRVNLFRSATERLVQAEPVPDSLCFWESGRGTEVDFVTAEDVAGVRGASLSSSVAAPVGNWAELVRRSARSHRRADLAR